MGQVIRFPIPHRPRGEVDPAYYRYFLDQMSHMHLEEVVVYVWRQIDKDALLRFRSTLPDPHTLSCPNWMKLEEGQFLYFMDHHRPQLIDVLCHLPYPINGPIRRIIAEHYRRYTVADG